MGEGWERTAGGRMRSRRVGGVTHVEVEGGGTSGPPAKADLPSISEALRRAIRAQALYGAAETEGEAAPTNGFGGEDPVEVAWEDEPEPGPDEEVWGWEPPSSEEMDEEEYSLYEREIVKLLNEADSPEEIRSLLGLLRGDK